MSNQSTLLGRNAAYQKNNNRMASKPKPRGSKAQKVSNGKSNLAIRGSKSKLETAPSAQSRFRSTGNPKQTNLPNGDVVIEHLEFIRDIAGSIPFAVTSSPVNPGQPATFPWLSQVAPLYESYLFEKLEFQFQNTCGSDTSGLAMLAIDYDASDPAPSDKIQMASYQGYARDASWKDFSHHSSLANLRKQKSYYVRSQALSANQDIKLYDVGNLFSAVVGTSADVPLVGELYVKYKVRLMTPQLGNVAVGLSKSARFTASTAANVTIAGSNAPLTITGNTTSGTVLTASAPYSCLVSLIATSLSGSPSTDTSASTCTIEAASTVINATTLMYSAQLTFSAGQTFSFVQGAAPNNQNISVGQFNTPVL